MSDDKKQLSRLEQIEARRKAYQEKLEAEAQEQRAIDLEAIFELELAQGNTNVITLEVPHTPGLPVLVAARCPRDAEVKRYRAKCKPDAKGRPGDAVAAAEQLAAVCRVYPDDETYAKLCEARPALHAQLGTVALSLAVGKEEAEGKG